MTFRRLVDADLPLLHRWLNDPEVIRWWEGDDVSWGGVVRRYGSTNDDPGEHWVALVGTEPVGWIQCYAWADYADEEESQALFAVGVERTAAGIDYLVGEAGHRGRGLGSAMIRAFVQTVVFGQHDAWTQVSAGPYVANEASWRALERAGFSPLGDYDDGAGDSCRVMVISRAALSTPPDAAP